MVAITIIAYTLKTDSQHKIHMVVKAKVSTKKNSKEFSNTFLNYAIKCTRYMKLSGMGCFVHNTDG